MSKKQIVRIVKERWRTERVDEELKGWNTARGAQSGVLESAGRSAPSTTIGHQELASTCFTGAASGS